MNLKRNLAGLAAACMLAAPALAAEGTFSTSNLTPEAALQAAQAALETCRDAGFQVTVAVTDRAGLPIVLLRDRFAGVHSVDAALGKARTAGSFVMSTQDLAEQTRGGSRSAAIRDVPGVLALGGGLPISAAGSLVGAIGVSGAPGGDADARCAQAGIDAIEEELEF